MECVSDWRDEFKFEVWGDIFAQGVKNLESLGMSVPTTKKKAVSSPAPSSNSTTVPSTDEKASLSSGVAKEAAVTEGDDYWKAEAESWRQKWEQEASTILTLEQTMQKMRSSGGAQIDTEAVKTAAKHLKVVKMQVEDLKDQTLHTKDKICAEVEDMQALVAKAVAAATASSGSNASAPAPAPAPAPEEAAAPAAEEAPAPAKKKSPKKEKASSSRTPKERLVSFFEEHNPSNISKIDKLLASYKGKEEDLFRKLKQKYGKAVPE